MTLRREDYGPLTGSATYLDDLAPSNALEIAFVRSPAARARVMDIDASAAVDVAGLYGIYTFDDLPPHLQVSLPLIVESPGLHAVRNRTPLVDRQVRHEAEPIAAILAADRYSAEDAAGLIRLELDFERPVISLKSSVGGLRAVHPDMPSNLAGVTEAAQGNVDIAFDKAKNVLEFEHVIERSTASPLEGRGILARPDGDGGLLVHASTQAPHGLRAALASVLGLPRRRVHVICPQIGGGFGQKGVFPSPEEVIVCWLALKWASPVKWLEDRRENLTAGTQARGQLQRIRVAYSDAGRIQAYEAIVHDDIGAYTPYGLVPSKNTATHLVGPYDIEATRVRVESYFTNLPPVAPYRGAGRPEGTYAIERTLDAVADAVGGDRTEIRLLNLIPAAALPYRTGLVIEGAEVVYDSGDYSSALRRAAELLPAMPSQEGRLVGRAVVNYVESTSFGPAERVHLSVEPEGDIVVRLATSDQGQGQATMAADVIAAELGVAPGVVDVRLGDTDAPDYGIGTFASRSTVMVANALADASDRLRSLCVEIAAKAWGSEVPDLAFNEGAVWHPDGRALTLQHLSVLTEPGRGHYGSERRLSADLREEGLSPPSNLLGLAVIGTFHQNEPTYAYGAHAAQVSIDAQTGMVDVDHYVVVHDCGVILDRARVDGQVHGGVAQGIGGALYERMDYDENGNLQNASFMDFLMPYATEIPHLEVHHMETPSPMNPLGLKGAGEGGVLPVSALVAAAIEDATGASVRRMPLKPDEILELIANGDASRE